VLLTRRTTRRGSGGEGRLQAPLSAAAMISNRVGAVSTSNPHDACGRGRRRIGSAARGAPPHSDSIGAWCVRRMISATAGHCKSAAAPSREAVAIRPESLCTAGRRTSSSCDNLRQESSGRRSTLPPSPVPPERLHHRAHGDSASAICGRDKVGALLPRKRECLFEKSHRIHSQGGTLTCSVDSVAPVVCRSPAGNG
jgi:hypothetical protein